MKTVGKQLQDARLARNWTPELAARETKIKVDRLRDLEADDYSHFTSPTYARGFVRTYARALGLDEYKILRQLDNKLPDDDSANIVTDTGVAYLPETAMPPRVAHRNYAGLYITMALGAVVTLAIVFVLFEAYRVGELSRWFASNPEPAAAGTNIAVTPVSPTAEPARALPVDSNTPPPIVDAASETNTAPATNAASATNATGATNAAADTAPGAPGLISPRALPVDPSELTNAASATPVPAITPPRALPVDPSELTNAASATPVSPTPPRALPVDPSELTNAAPATVVAVNTPPVEPSPAPTPTPNSAPQTSTAANQPLVLTASQDSFVRVTNLDAEAEKPLYAAVLRSGQSVGFSGHKFSINVGIPSAVDIKLDGVNYGPHSDQDAPETFTVQSHLQ